MKVARQISLKDAAQRQAELGRVNPDSDGFTLLRKSNIDPPKADLTLNHWLLPSGYLIIGDDNEGLLLTDAIEAISESAFFTSFSRGDEFEIDVSKLAGELSDVLIGIDYGMRRNVYHMLILSLSKYALMESILPSGVEFVVPSADAAGTLPMYRGAVSAFRGRRLRQLQPGLYKLKNAHYVNAEGNNPAYISLFSNVLHALSAMYDDKPVPSNPTARSLFISRQNSADSRLTTREAVEIDALLRTYDVTTVVLEDLDFERQLRLFRNARLIVGPHGAGLSFFVFASKGALLVELNATFFGEEHRRPWFGLLTLGGRREYREIFDTDGPSRPEQLAVILREKFGEGETALAQAIPTFVKPQAE